MSYRICCLWAREKVIIRPVPSPHGIGVTSLPFTRSFCYRLLPQLFDYYYHINCFSHNPLSPNTGHYPFPPRTTYNTDAAMASSTITPKLPQTVLNTNPSAFTSGGTPLSPADYSASVGSPTSSQKFPRLSLPVPMMREEYDCIVIGSGYGGGVAASRTARAGKRVCILELGQERWPGEYPVSGLDAFKQVHVSGNRAANNAPIEDFTKGDPTGMYHLILGEGQNAFVANGLGGTSLLNANIFLETDDRTMALENSWPEELRRKGALKKYYDRARSVLQPTPYPEDQPELMKLNLLKKQAEIMGLGDKFYRPPQTTFFKDGLNSTGVEVSWPFPIIQDHSIFMSE
jgi:hypothetical protein